MSGICDTCQRNQSCRRPMEGMDSCRLYVSGKESRYEKLFGTPERAARTIANNCQYHGSFDCSYGCMADGTVCGCGDYDALLEWMRGDAE